jgi:hypothetical protein
MGRLIDYQPALAPGSRLAINVGDVIVIKVSGVRVREGADIVEVLGPLMSSVVGDTGEVFSPMGTPNAIVIVGRAAGHATLELMLGEPWRTPKRSTLDLEIAP